MFENIIVPLDGSDRSVLALGPAGAIARFLGAKVTLVSLAPRGDEGQVRAWVGSQTHRLGTVKRESLVETMTVGVGEHLERIVDESANALVCMSTHGRGRSAGVMGSVASELLQRVDRPVLLLGPNYEEHRFRCHGNLVATVDGSKHSEAILPAVEAFALAFGFDVTLTTVVDTRGAMAIQLAGASSSEVLVESTYVHNVAARAAAEIEQPVQFEVLHGPKPAGAIIDYAESLDAALIAMATHGSAGLRRVLAGSVTAAVVRDARCPVLAIRPVALST